MENQKENQNKRIVERSVAYPSINLEEAIRLADILRTNYQNTPFSRESFTLVLKITDHRKLAALVHFGLVLRTGNTYTLTELSKNIHFAPDEDSRLAHLQQAAENPKLYKSLIKRYLGQALPAALPNILVLQSKINSKVAKNVASDFIKSLEYAGLMKNNIIYSTSANDTEENKETENNEQENFQTTNELKNGYPEETFKHTPGYLQIPLKSGVIVSFPKDMAYEVATGKFSEALKELELTTKDS